MSNNILHTRLVTIHHRLAAVFKKELNIRRRRFVAIRRYDHVLILEAKLRHDIRYELLQASTSAVLIVRWGNVLDIYCCYLNLII